MKEMREREKISYRASSSFKRGGRNRAAFYQKIMKMLRIEFALRKMTATYYIKFCVCEGGEGGDLLSHRSSKRSENVSSLDIHAKKIWNL
jgi:hypothetical protein